MKSKKAITWPFAELNRHFHEAIVAASGNKVLLQVFENLRANLTRVAMLSFRLGVQRTSEGTPAPASCRGARGS